MTSGPEPPDGSTAPGRGRPPRAPRAARRRAGARPASSRPPGKRPRPRCRRRSLERRVSTTRASPASSNIATSTALSRRSATSPAATPDSSSSGSGGTTSGDRPRASASRHRVEAETPARATRRAPRHGAGRPGSASGGRGIALAPPGASAVVGVLHRRERSDGIQRRRTGQTARPRRHLQAVACATSSRPCRPCRPCRPSPAAAAAPASAFSGLSATRASVVSSSAAIDAAFCSAERVTLAGSMTPALTRSSISPVDGVEPDRSPSRPRPDWTTTAPSSPALIAIHLSGSSSALARRCVHRSPRRLRASRRRPATAGAAADEGGAATGDDALFDRRAGRGRARPRCGASSPSARPRWPRRP